MDKHSKTPWRIGPSHLDGCDAIFDADDKTIHVFERDIQDAINADLIVKAVNGLPELVKASITCLDLFKYWHNTNRKNLSATSQSTGDRIIVDLDKALAAVGAEEKP